MKNNIFDRIISTALWVVSLMFIVLTFSRCSRDDNSDSQNDNSSSDSEKLEWLLGYWKLELPNDDYYVVNFKENGIAEIYQKVDGYYDTSEEQYSFDVETMVLSFFYDDGTENWIVKKLTKNTLEIKEKL